MPERTPFDESYKLLFSHPEMVRELLLGFVHEDWVKDLDFSTLSPYPTEYIIPAIPGEPNKLLFSSEKPDDFNFMLSLVFIKYKILSEFSRKHTFVMRQIKVYPNVNIVTNNYSVFNGLLLSTSLV